MRDAGARAEELESAGDGEARGRQHDAAPIGEDLVVEDGADVEGRGADAEGPVPAGGAEPVDAVGFGRQERLPEQALTLGQPPAHDLQLAEGLIRLLHEVPHGPPQVGIERR